jgi:hypothetical protein
LLGEAPLLGARFSQVNRNLAAIFSLLVAAGTKARCKRTQRKNHLCIGGGHFVKRPDKQYKTRP